MTLPGKETADCSMQFVGKAILDHRKPKKCASSRLRSDATQHDGKKTQSHDIFFNFVTTFEHLYVKIIKTHVLEEKTLYFMLVFCFIWIL